MVETETFLLRKYLESPLLVKLWLRCILIVWLRQLTLLGRHNILSSLRIRSHALVGCVEHIELNAKNVDDLFNDCLSCGVLFLHGLLDDFSVLGLICFELLFIIRVVLAPLLKELLAIFHGSLASFKTYKLQ